MTRSDGAPPTPGEAFALLGNETRVDILQELAAADDPLSFTDLRNRVGLRQGGQFNYHLTKLVGHFVSKTDAGYSLRQPGSRVVQAVLAGAVDAGPDLEPTAAGYDCHFCGGSVVIRYADGELAIHCQQCYDAREAAIPEGEGGDDRPTHRFGNLARVTLPPAALRNRTPNELLRAAATWTHLDAVALSSGVCPVCAAAVDCEVDPCLDHVRTEARFCTRCGHYHAVRPRFSCPNCHVEFEYPAVMALLAAPELLAFVGARGLNVTSSGFDWGWRYDEEVLSADPFEARFTFTIAGDQLTLTVDDSLRVVDATP